MKIGDAIRSIFNETGLTQAQVGKMIGVKSQSVIAMRLRMKNLSVDTVLEMLDAVGYELVIQKKKPGRNAADQIVIDGGESK